MISKEQIIDEKINFEKYNDIDLHEGLNHSNQSFFKNNVYNSSNIEDVLAVRKDLLYGNSSKNIDEISFFTISSHDSFNNLLQENCLTWNGAIIYSPLNDHSRSSLKKGDILFCNRIGQFGTLSQALDSRGVYGIGIAIEDPQIYYPAESGHSKYGIKVVFPLALTKSLSTRSIQLNSITIDQTPYNGNRNDSLQKIDTHEKAKELLKMLVLENPYFSKFLKVFYNYDINTGMKESALEQSGFNSIDVAKTFVEWFKRPENSKKAYLGLLDYDILKSWDHLFFENSIFNIDFKDLAGSFEKIGYLLEDKKKNNQKWKDFDEACSKGAPSAILGKMNYLRFLKEFDWKKAVSNPLRNNYNKIIYGAPGTGKSHKIIREFKTNNVSEYFIERVVFHPDYDYHSFIGGYKPITELNHESKEVVNYRFVPQIFLNTVIKAIEDPYHNYYLVIEEINRGNCAEIFGDMFQLLDRNPEYKVTPSQEMRYYLDKLAKEKGINYLNGGKLGMPYNLVILATMNTSDQSLYPMDSAFKRRWEWEYEPINYPSHKEDKSCNSFVFKIKINEGEYLSWVHFIKVVNGIIAKVPGLGMDKFLGNYFVKANGKNEIEGEEFINKVVFYLWNDVFRDEPNSFFDSYTFNDYLPWETKGKEKLREFVGIYGNEFHFEV